MSLWMDGMDWRTKPLMPRNHKETRMPAALAVESSETIKESPPGMIFERLGALKAGSVFWESAFHKGKEYLFPRVVVEPRYTQENEPNPVVLYYDEDDRKFLWMRADVLVLFEEQIGVGG